MWPLLIQFQIDGSNGCPQALFRENDIVFFSNEPKEFFFCNIIVLIHYKVFTLVFFFTGAPFRFSQKPRVFNQTQESNGCGPQYSPVVY